MTAEVRQYIILVPTVTETRPLRSVPVVSGQARHHRAHHAILFYLAPNRHTRSITSVQDLWHRPRISNNFLFCGSAFSAHNGVPLWIDLKTSRYAVFRKRWQILHVDEMNGRVTNQVVIMNIITSWNKSELVIPKRFLQYGYYMALFTITMWGEWLLSKKC